tara:strand:- start:221 stop:646 length:426 start_codon:yes stop_codon:yes gene_type:complete
MNEVKRRIKEHEGYRNKVYLDHLGNRTIFYGHLCDAGEPYEEDIEYSKEEAEKVFDQDFHDACDLAKTFIYDPDKHHKDIYGVCIEMAFQLGSRLFKFKNFRAALEKKDYETSCQEMKSSLWAEQTPGRCDALIKIIGKHK